MVTRNRPQPTRVSLESLLNNRGVTVRVWLWHQGGCDETRRAVESLLGHPAIRDYHHHAGSAAPSEPLNWFWKQADAELLGQVAATSRVAHDWARRLAQVHRGESSLGVLASWPFRPDDYQPRIASRKLVPLGDGLELLPNCWIGGSSYLMKRNCLFGQGMPRPRECFDAYCLRLAREGWRIGWPVPLILEERSDDPANPSSWVRSDDDLLACEVPTPAWPRGRTVVQWEQQWRAWARRAQRASADPRWYLGWRR